MQMQASMFPAHMYSRKSFKVIIFILFINFFIYFFFTSLSGRVFVQVLHAGWDSRMPPSQHIAMCDSSMFKSKSPVPP